MDAARAASAARTCGGHALCRSSVTSSTSLSARSAVPRLQLAAHHRKAARSARVVLVTASGQEVIAVTGATGFVGKRLVKRLLADGAQVRILTRNSLSARLALPEAALSSQASFHVHDTLSGDLGWFDAVKGCTGVINLAGAPISTRWDEGVKRSLVSSRLNATRLLVKAINALPENERPEAFVSSSAIGFYGTSERAEFDERSGAGRDFLANLCKDWEAAAKEATGTRTTLVRTGVVLDKDGGALAKILPIFYAYGGGPIGSGRQWFSWIHRDDLVELILAALRNPAYSGAVNGTAPYPVRFGQLCEAVAAATNRPNLLPVPGFAIKLLLGEGATVVLDGQRVLPKRAEQQGFAFQYPTIEEALAQIVGGYPARAAAPAATAAAAPAVAAAAAEAAPEPEAVGAASSSSKQE